MAIFWRNLKRHVGFALFANSVLRAPFDGFRYSYPRKTAFFVY